MPSIDLRHSHCGKREQIAERRVQALELRKAGLSYRKIAERLDISPNRAHVAVRSALADLAAKETVSAEQVRQLELERLDLALTQVAQVLSRTTSDETKLRAVDRLVRISESRRRLLGVDLEKATVNVDQRSVTFIIEPMAAHDAAPGVVCVNSTPPAHVLAPAVAQPATTAAPIDDARHEPGRNAESSILTDDPHASDRAQVEGDASPVAIPHVDGA